MKRLLYILLLSPLIANAQLPVHGNATIRFLKDLYYNVVDSVGDTTFRFYPATGRLVLTNKTLPAGINISGTDARLVLLGNGSNSVYRGSYSSLPSNSEALYAAGGTMDAPTATPAGSQFMLEVYRGHDGTGWFNAGFTLWGAISAWTTATGGRSFYKEFRATSRNTNTAATREYWSGATNTYYFNPGTDGKFANGLAQSIEPIGKAYLTGLTTDTVLVIQAPTSTTKDVMQAYIGSSLVFRVDKDGNYIGRQLPRTDSVASSATVTPIAAGDVYKVTALAVGTSIAAPSGTLYDGQRVRLRIRDNGVSQTLSWGSIYRAGTTLALPSNTTAGKTLYADFIYNSTDSKLDLVGFADGF